MYIYICTLHWHILLKGPNSHRDLAFTPLYNSRPKSAPFDPNFTPLINNKLVPFFFKISLSPFLYATNCSQFATIMAANKLKLSLVKFVLFLSNVEEKMALLPSFWIRQWTRAEWTRSRRNESIFSTRNRAIPATAERCRTAWRLAALVPRFAAERSPAEGARSRTRPLAD